MLWTPLGTEIQSFALDSSRIQSFALDNFGVEKLIGYDVNN
ncbi:hypothetical protein BGP_6352 [Beggiatoa sp. PS]|nr:hypothetical protein BGP_6352 [Beggiatoa sp. PS]